MEIHVEEQKDEYLITLTDETINYKKVSKSKTRKNITKIMTLMVEEHEKVKYKGE